MKETDIIHVGFRPCMFPPFKVSHFFHSACCLAPLHLSIFVMSGCV